MKVRYRALEQNANRLFATCTLAHPYLVRRHLLRLAGAWCVCAVRNATPAMPPPGTAQMGTVWQFRIGVGVAGARSCYTGARREVTNPDPWPRLVGTLLLFVPPTPEAITVGVAGIQSDE